jgi:CrcB protein
MLKLDILYVALGAILGASLRYFVGEKPVSIYGLPVSILIINIVGSFILGLTMTGVEEYGLDGRYVLFFGVGFCGSFTTMSSFAFEAVSLADAGKLLLSILDVLLNVGLSLVALVLGRLAMLALL